MTKDEALKLALEALILTSGMFQKQRDAIRAIREVLAQPEQEPVATVIQFDGEKIIDASMEFFDKYPIGTELYTSPPHRKPLTDEECDRIYTALDQWSREFDQYEFGLPTHCGEGMVGGRSIIRAAHGIKGEA